MITSKKVLRQRIQDMARGAGGCEVDREVGEFHELGAEGFARWLSAIESAFADDVHSYVWFRRNLCRFDTADTAAELLWDARKR